MLLVIYWVICSGLAVMAVNVQIQGQQRASTVVRKYFHVLAVAVFIPGLIRECCFLYLASGVVLAVITALEVRKYLWDICETEFVQLYSIVRCGVLSWTDGELRVLTAQGRSCIPSRGENPFLKILHNYQYDFVSENIRNVKAINDLMLSHAAKGHT